jgi:curved DNA-binding protein CbpA
MEEVWIMPELQELTDKIKILKDARDILDSEYKKTEFHKKKEEHPQSSVPSDPEDEEIYKLLTAIRQLEHYIKKYQDDQFMLIKEETTQ